MRPYFHVVMATLSITITTVNHFSIICAFTLFVSAVRDRNRFLNLILEQLLFNEPLNEKYLFVDSKYGILSHELNRMHRFYDSTHFDKFKAWRKIWHTTESTILFRKRSNETPDTYGRKFSGNVTLNNNWPLSVKTIEISNRKNSDSEVEALLKSYTLKDIGVLNRMSVMHL